MKAPCFHPRVFAARFFKYWLPVIIWMVVIFGASTNLGTPKNTSRIIGPILRWIAPAITDETVAKVQFGIRKSAHAIEYAILALLIWRARRKTVLIDARGWSWREAGIAILIAAIYAATDELHQQFVPERQGSFWDVLLDTAGAAAGMLALWKIGRWLKRW